MAGRVSGDEFSTALSSTTVVGLKNDWLAAGEGGVPDGSDKLVVF